MPIIDGRTRYDRRTPKDPTEARQMARIRGGLHLLTDADLMEIRGDWDAGIAREVADTELERRAGMSAHERMRERIGRSE